MSRQQVGVDLGSTAVRAVAISGTDENGMPQVTAVSIVPLPPGAIAGGVILHADIVADALRKALKQGKMSTYGVVVGLVAANVAIAMVPMPAAVKPTEWANVLRLDGTEVSPLVKLHEAYLGFSRVPVLEENPETTIVSVSAVRREDVDQLLEMCRIAKVTPRAVDLGAAATFRGLTAMPSRDHSTVASVVDVGATTTTVSTRVGLRLRSVRLIDEGSATISLALKGALNTSYEKAEELKKSVRVGDEDRSVPRSSAARALASAYGAIEDPDRPEEQEDLSLQAERAATAAADGLVERIASAIESDSAHNPRNPTTSVTLCGRGALMRGLAARVENRLGVATFVRRPYMNVVENQKTGGIFTDGALDPAQMLELVTATGLAMWKGES